MKESIKTEMRLLISTVSVLLQNAHKSNYVHDQLQFGVPYTQEQQGSSDIQYAVYIASYVIATMTMCVIDILNESCSILLFNCYRAPTNNRNVDAINYIKDMCNCIIELTPANNAV